MSAGGGTVAAVIAQRHREHGRRVLTTPFVATAIVVLYFDLRIWDEAYDVQLLIQRNDVRIAVVLAAVLADPAVDPDTPRAETRSTSSPTVAIGPAPPRARFGDR